MDSFFGFLKFFVGCGTLMLIGFVVLAHLPKSPLRTLLVQICGWGTAALCGVYTVSPIDALPEVLLGPIGGIDDLIAIVVGIMSARAAWKAGKERTSEQDQGQRDAA